VVVLSKSEDIVCSSVEMVVVVWTQLTALRALLVVVVLSSSAFCFFFGALQNYRVCSKYVYGPCCATTALLESFKILEE